MGDFAAQAAVAHFMGSARGERSQLSAVSLGLDDFLSALGETINQLLIGRRGALIENAMLAGQRDPRSVNNGIQVERSAAEPKDRWVDGTPENSLHIPALRKLFPAAQFIHLVRDPSSVVKSMLLFDVIAGVKLVQNEQDAYEYWLRCVRASLAAERAWGPGVVMRLHYDSLVSTPKAVLRRILEFLGLPWSDACLEPLQVRLNSSRVPKDFDPRDKATDPAVRVEAESVAKQIAEMAGEVLGPDPAVADEQWAAFRGRVEYLRTLDNYYLDSQAVVGRLQGELATSNAWAIDLDGQLAEAKERIGALQKLTDERTAWALDLDNQIAAANARIVELQKQVEERTTWALDLDRQIAAANARIIDLQKLVEERTAWALDLDRKIASANARISELQSPPPIAQKDS